MHQCKAYTINRAASIGWGVLVYAIMSIAIALLINGLIANESAVTIFTAIGWLGLLPVSYSLGRRIAAQPHHMQLFENRLEIQDKFGFTLHVAIGKENYNIRYTAGSVNYIEILDTDTTYKFYPVVSIFYLNADFAKLALALEKMDGQLIKPQHPALESYLFRKPIVQKHTKWSRTTERLEPFAILIDLVVGILEALT